MFPRPIPRAYWRALSTTALLSLLAACTEPLDSDLRGLGGGFSTAAAAQSTSADRPQPDARGLISYPSYQVAVARRGDTVAAVARRIGADPAQLSSFNAIAPDVPLREGEIIALPDQLRPAPAVAVPAAAPVTTTPVTTTTAAPARVDVTTLAGQAIDKAPETKPAQTPEPIRHKVQRGETAYTISRRYGVKVRQLARWNGLGPDYAIREGQYLLIPANAARPVETTTAGTTAPGEGSPTPQPPSSTKPLPKDPAPVKQAKASEKPVADLGKQTKPAAQGKFARPVTGTVIRDYTKGRHEGINIKAAPGTAVKASEGGTVAAITESAEGVPIVVIRHKGNLLTVYANVTDVAVKKGDKVRRGQAIARLRDGDQSFVHFEVRQGFDSVDPNEYLG